jgi:hypothetical protein
MTALVLLLVAWGARAETVVFDGGVFTDIAGVASDGDPINPAGIGQKVSDDFQVGIESRTVTDVEWTGLYGALGQAALAHSATPDDDFTIAFYDDADGVPGRVLSKFQPGKVARVLRDDGSWSYRYKLPTPIKFNPGCVYHIAIVNSIPGDAYWCWSQNAGGTNHSAPTGSSEWIRWPGDCAFRLTYTAPSPVQASTSLPLLIVGLVSAGILGFRRYIL